MPLAVQNSIEAGSGSSLDVALSLLRDAREKSSDMIVRDKLDDAIRIIAAASSVDSHPPKSNLETALTIPDVKVSTLVQDEAPPVKASTALSKIQFHLDFGRSWLGSFLATASTLWIFKRINSANDLSPSVLLVLPGSFGALATIVYALPLAPTAQPWPISHCHTVGLVVAAVLSFVYRDVFHIPRATLTWLEVAISVATATKVTSHVVSSGGVTHPLAGGVAFFVANYANTKEYSHEGLGYLVISIYAGLFVFVLTAILVSNVDFIANPGRKKYPQDTIPEGGWGRSTFIKMFNRT
jgi:hypothetical protein